MTDADAYARLMADFDALCEAPVEVREQRIAAARREDPERARQLERMLEADRRQVSLLPAGLPSLGDLVTGSPAGERRDRPLPAQLGEAVGGYRLASILGKGGMGCVYLGVHEALGRKAAVKLLYPDLCSSDEYVSRFLYEAKIVNEVHDPNIVDIFDFVVVEEPRRVACIMELLEGPSLAEVLAKGPLTGEQAVNLCVLVCHALRAVHGRGVVHRDLKPDNIVVVAPLDSSLAEEGAIRVLDFGIAKVGARDVEHRTQSGAILGTPEYMAPEQVAAGEVTAATDVYAVGELFYEAVTGRRAFSGSSLDLMAHKMSSEPVELAWPPGAPPGAVRLVQDCLRFRPEERPPLVEVEARLLALRGPMGAAEGARRPPWWPLIALVLLLGLAGYVYAASTSSASAGASPPLEEVAEVAGLSAAAPPPEPVSTSTEAAAPGGPRLAPEPQGTEVARPAAAAAPTRAPRPARTSRPLAPPPPGPAAPAATTEVRLDSVPSNGLVEDVATRQVLGTTPLSLEVQAGHPRTVLVTSGGFTPARVRLTGREGQRTVRLVPATIQADEVKPW